jgi:hypothetical protein
VWYHVQLERQILTVAKTQTKGVIETISAGFAVLNRRLLVLLIPVALDVYFWLGAQVSFAPFFRLVRGELSRFAALLNDDPRAQEQLVVQMQNADMRSVLALADFIPSLVPQLLESGRIVSERVIAVNSPPGMIGWFAAINLVALLVSSVFLTLLAAGVRQEHYSLLQYARRSLTAAAGIGGYLLALLGVGVLVGVPLALGVLAQAQVVPVLAMLLLFSGFILAFWLYIYTGFAVEAVVISRVGPLRAIRMSIWVVRHALLSTVALVVLIGVVMGGMSVVLSMLVVNVWGLLLAILGNAYIGSGLAAARMIFFRERLAEQIRNVAA